MAHDQRRGTCWSITINNPVESDLPSKDALAPGWSYQGQMEKCPTTGTPHYQGLVKTPQVRFIAVKKVFPRAHIELAKNQKALANYVHKPETRIAEVPSVQSAQPSMWDYHNVIASMWSDEEYIQLQSELSDEDILKGEAPLLYVDKLVARDIEQGRVGAEFIAVNPQWRSAWKKFWRSILVRQRKISETIIIDGESETIQSRQSETATIIEEEVDEETGVCNSSKE